MEVSPLGQLFVRITRAKLQSAEVIFPKEKSKIICLGKHWEHRLFFLLWLCASSSQLLVFGIIGLGTDTCLHWHVYQAPAVHSNFSKNFLMFDYLCLQFGTWLITSIWSRCEVWVFSNVENCQLFACSLRLPRFAELERILHHFSSIKVGWEITLHFHFCKVKFLLRYV